MKIVSANITGSLILNSVDITNVTVSSSVWSGSFSTRVTSLESFSSSLNNTFATDAELAAATASLIITTTTLSSSLSLRTFKLESTSSVLTTASSSFAAVSSSYAPMSASISTRVTTAESTLNTVSSSYAAASASLSTRVTSAESTLSTVSSSYAAASASLSTRTTALETASGSYSTRVTNLEATSSTVSSSYAATSASISNRVKLIEDNYATTGSNTLTGTQNITNTTNPTGFTTTAAVYTAGGLQVSKDTYVSGSLYVKGNVTVYGTQSINYITSSQLDISDNIINLNTALPGLRFGGIAVYDSGSTGLTGSLLWDSQNNTWIYSNPSGSGNYDSSMVIMGPRNATGLGNEVGLSCNYLVQGHGHHHTTSSMIFHDGSTTCLPGAVVGGGTACFASTVCSAGNILLGGAGTANTIPQYTAAGVLGNSKMVTYGNGCYNVNFGWSNCNRVGFDNDNTGTYFYGLELDYGTRRLNIIGKAPDGNTGVGIWTGTTSYSQRLNINSDGIACFACQVCAPTISISGNVNGGTATFNGIAINNSPTSAGTSANFIRLTNTGGDFYIGQESNTGGFFTGAGAYDNVLYGGRPLNIIMEGSSKIVIATNGVACFSCQVCAPYFTAPGVSICGINGCTWLTLDALKDGSSGTTTGLYLNTRHRSGGVNNVNHFGLAVTPNFETNSSNLGTVYGAYIAPSETGTYNVDTAFGLFVKAVCVCSGTLTNSFAAVFLCGNVGIGTASPVRKLDIISTGEQLRLAYDTSGTVYSDFRNDSAGGLLINTSGGYIINYIGGNAKMRIDASATCFAGTVCALNFITPGITNSTSAICSNYVKAYCDTSDTRYLQLYMGNPSTYNAAPANTVCKIVSGISFNWYSECWLMGATRGGSTDIDSFVIGRNGATNMTINSAGKVIIATSCAAFGRNLTVQGDVVAYYSDQESVTMGISAGTGAQSWGIQVCDTGDGSNTLHLNARGGYVGINKGAGNSASYPLDVTGTTKTDVLLLGSACSPSAGINYLGQEGYRQKWLITQGRYRFCFGTQDFYGAMFIEIYGTNYNQGTSELRNVKAAVNFRYAQSKSIAQIYNLGGACVGAYLTNGIGLVWCNISDTVGDLIFTNAGSNQPDAVLAAELQFLSTGNSLAGRFTRICYTTSLYDSTNPYV